MKSMGFYERSDSLWEAWKDEGSHWECIKCRKYNPKTKRCEKYNNKPIYISDKQCNRDESKI